MFNALLKFFEKVCEKAIQMLKKYDILPIKEFGMLELKFKKNTNNKDMDWITFNNDIALSFTFLDDPNKIMKALLEMIVDKKESAVCNICDDFESKVFVFISNAWEEKIIIISNEDLALGNEHKMLCCNNVSIKENAISFLNSDLLKYIERYNNSEHKKLYKSLMQNFNKLKKAVNDGSTIYENEMKRLSALNRKK